MTIGANLDWADADRGLTALHRAAAKGHHVTVATLLNLGSKSLNKPDSKGQVGCRVLFVEAPSSCSTLLERSQNLLSGPNLVEITISFKPCEVNFHNLLDVLRASSADACICPQTPLHWAVFGGCPATVSFLLDMGAPPRTADLQGRTPAHVAMAKGLLEILDRLKSKGAEGSIVENEPFVFCAKSIVYRVRVWSVCEGDGCSSRDRQRDRDSYKARD